MEELIQRLIQDVRPALQSDGGDVDFVKLENNIVYVRLKGTCHGCPMAQITLKQGIEKYIKDNAPEITSVVAV